MLTQALKSCGICGALKHSAIKRSMECKKRTNVAVADCQGNLLSTGMNE